MVRIKLSMAWVESPFVGPPALLGKSSAALREWRAFLWALWLLSPARPLVCPALFATPERQEPHEFGRVRDFTTLAHRRRGNVPSGWKSPQRRSLARLDGGASQCGNRWQHKHPPPSIRHLFVPAKRAARREFTRLSFAFHRISFAYMLGSAANAILPHTCLLAGRKEIKHAVRVYPGSCWRSKWITRNLHAVPTAILASVGDLKMFPRKE